MHPKGQRKLRGTITAQEVVSLKEALSSARMEKCSFDEETKAMIRPYLNSWVAAPIQRVLNGLEARHNKSAPKPLPVVDKTQEDDVNSGDYDYLNRD
jgi:hypothetical protein